MGRINRKITVSAAAVMMLMGTAAFGIDRFESKKEKKARETETRIVLNQAEKNGVKLISMEEAKDTALNAAGVNEKEIKYLKIKLDREDDYNPAVYIYEVEFLHDGLEYKFEINGENKDILKSDVDSWLD